MHGFKRRLVALAAGALMATMAFVPQAMPAHATTQPKYVTFFFGRSQYEAATGGATCTASGGSPAPVGSLGSLKTLDDALQYMNGDSNFTKPTIPATGGVVTGTNYTSTTSTQACNGAVLYPTWSQLQGYYAGDTYGTGLYDYRLVPQSQSYDPSGDGVSGLKNATVEDNATTLNNETCGANQDLLSHGIDYGFSMFAFPNNKFDKKLIDHVKTCYAGWRMYGEGNNTQSSMNTGTTSDLSYSSTLNGAITSTATSISINDAIAPPATPFVITLDSEDLNVTAKSGTGPYTLTVARGFNGTTKAAHSDGITVQAPVSFDEKIWSMDGGACSNSAALCYDATTANEYVKPGPSTDANSPEGKFAAMPGGNWRDFQFYKFVNGCYPTNAAGTACAPGANADQYLHYNGTGGATWTLTYNGQTTGALSATITSSALQTAITGLSSVGSGNATVTGTAPDFTVYLNNLTLIPKFTGTHVQVSVDTFQWDCTNSDASYHWASDTELYCWSDFTSFIDSFVPGIKDGSVIATSPDTVMQEPSFAINPSGWGTNLDEVQYIHASTGGAITGNYKLEEDGPGGATSCWLLSGSCVTSSINVTDDESTIQLRLNIDAGVGWPTWINTWPTQNTQVEVRPHDYNGTLVNNINATQTTAVINVTNDPVGKFPPALPFIMKFTGTSERVNVTAISGSGSNRTLTIVRGFKQTTATSHSSGDIMSSKDGNGALPWNSGYDVYFVAQNGDVNWDAMTFPNQTSGGTLGLTTVVVGSGFTSDRFP